MVAFLAVHTTRSTHSLPSTNIPFPKHEFYFYQLACLKSVDSWILDRCADLVDVCTTHFPLADLDVIVNKLRSFWINDLSKLYLVRT